MTRGLGFSIYPEKTRVEEDMAYIRLAAAYGFKRMFTCFLSVELTKNELVEKYKPLIGLAKTLGIDTYVDVYPSFFDNMGIALDDLSFFKELGAAGFRLDRSFSGSEESLMTYNSEGVIIEVNISNDTSYVENILDFQPNKDQLVGCHNFYPQRYSGLKEEYFVQATKRYKCLGLHTAAFVSSQTGTVGPWDISEGQPTLERDRHLPIDLQARAMWACADIDDIIIGNAYATEAELKQLSEIQPYVVNFSINQLENISEVEAKICYDELHFQRGDISSYMVRSTASRAKYKAQTIEARPAGGTINVGDVLIANDRYGIYAGELQIALEERENDGVWNIVGSIPKEEHFMLPYITPWKKFIFRKEGIL
ncbi:DUF871 domain-containing protein [Enterococcus sp. BWM-S5]|uniref:DUF871 domain-containing protein n=1 Tax=Enterococcus larvae TaxID=2794352 RepID=A0ABS4CLH1_9ENTE|nr:MupG family TIM beta-alpha barrel fold protein [Enterococcus larvae]MBP1046885.1 DUF871 domain-containing protein [Enterococcus larvae]